MENTNLKEMWNDYGSKIEESRVLNMQSWALNLQCMEMIQAQKAKSKIRSLLAAKVLGVFVGVIWILFLGTLVYFNNFKNPFFTISVGIILLFNTVAVFNYIRHLVMIGEINYSESITDVQEKISKLQSSLISNNRFLLLQFPFYTTWTYSMHWIVNDPLSFWLIEFPVTVLLAVLGVWLYRNYSKKNIHKPWVRALMNGSGFSSVTKALDFINEIEEYKKDRR
jgi:hypothetical protein